MEAVFACGGLYGARFRFISGVALLECEAHSSDGLELSVISGIVT